MTQAAKSLLESLLQLPDSDRGELAAVLLDSLDGDAEENVDSEWAEEIRSRVEEVRNGQVKTIPWSVAREQIMDDSNHG
jgi:putative addiction module component (TIGR02574 family)